MPESNSAVVLFVGMKNWIICDHHCASLFLLYENTKWGSILSPLFIEYFPRIASVFALCERPLFVSLLRRTFSRRACATIAPKLLGNVENKHTKSICYFISFLITVPVTSGSAFWHIQWFLHIYFNASHTQIWLCGVSRDI